MDDDSPLLSLSQEEVDALPFGLIALDPEGIIVRYNRAESSLSGLDPQGVLGRNFFEQVAPCTNVREFAGLYREMVKAREMQSWEFSFTFRFAAGARHVHIRLAYFPQRSLGLVLVQDLDQSRSGR